MASRFDTTRRDAFADWVRTWPVGAFDVSIDADVQAETDIEADGGSALGLRALFGPGTTVRPHVYCEDLGAWQNGNTALVVLPVEVGGGVAGLFFDEYHHDRPWRQMGLGRRIEETLRLARKARVHESIPALAMALMEHVAHTLRDVPDADVAAVSLNSWGEVWLLRHCVDVLDGEDRAALQTMLALRPEWERVQAVFERAGRLVANLPHNDVIEQVVREAVIRHNGVTLNGRQIEKLSVGEAMLSAPREEWDRVAGALVALRYADGLDASYHPAPERPAAKKRTGSKTASGWSFCIAA